MKRLFYLLCIIMVLASCKSSKQTSSNPPEGETTAKCLSSKLQISIPNSSMTVNGSMKVKEGERLQITVLMPILRSELFRIEVSPSEVLVVDRMNKQYVQATQEEIAQMAPVNLQYGSIEKLIFDAALPGANTELTTSDLGLPYIPGAKVRLSDFSTKEFDLPAMTAPERYKKVTIEDFIDSLDNL